MMKGIIYILIAILLIIPVFAEQTSLGITKQEDCVRIYQTCGNCTYITILSVLSPINKSVLLNNTNMTTNNNYEYYYDFCNTTVNGNYIVNLLGDVDGIATPVSYDFDVNDRGVIVRDNTTNIAIIIVLLVLILLGSFLTFYLDEGLKLPFFLGTVLTAVFAMNVVSNIASDSGASQVIVSLLWFGYRVGLYMFWGLLLYVLIKLTTELKIRKNPPPTMGSPLKAARQDRLQRQGRQ